LAKPLGMGAAVTDAAGGSRHHPQSRKIAADAELMTFSPALIFVTFVRSFEN
jgi:hypothetical protein